MSMLCKEDIEYYYEERELGAIFGAYWNILFDLVNNKITLYNRDGSEGIIIQFQKENRKHNILFLVLEDGIDTDYVQYRGVPKTQINKIITEAGKFLKSRY